MLCCVCDAYCGHGKGDGACTVANARPEGVGRVCCCVAVACVPQPCPSPVMIDVNSEKYDLWRSSDPAQQCDSSRPALSSPSCASLRDIIMFRSRIVGLVGRMRLHAPCARSLSTTVGQQSGALPPIKFLVVDGYTREGRDGLRAGSSVLCVELYLLCALCDNGPCGVCRRSKRGWRALREDVAPVVAQGSGV